MLEWFVGSSKASLFPKFVVLDSFKPLIPWSGMTVLANRIHGLGATLDGEMRELVEGLKQSDVTWLTIAEEY